MSKIDEPCDTELTSDFSDGVFRFLVDQSSDVTILVASTGDILYVSPSVRVVLGYSTVSSSMALLLWMHPDDRSRLITLFQSVLSEPQTFVSRFRHQDGHWVTCSLKIQDCTEGIYPALGEAPRRCYHLNLRPFSSTSETASEAPAINQPDVSRQQNISALMIHELRTPINAINGFSQLLLLQKRSPLALEQQDMVQRILRNGQNLLRLINTVLDFSKLDSGYIRLNLETLNIVEILDQTLQDLSSLAIQKNIKIQTKIQLVDPMVVNDSQGLKQIIVNLVSNALNVSEHGMVTVSLKMDDVHHLRLSVQDSGPGIAPHERALIFEEFSQLKQTAHLSQMGTGLGLAICRRLVQMMQGDIQVQSQLGDGATFLVVIPRYVSV